MNEKSLLIVMFLIGLLALNNAVFNGLSKENRLILGFIGIGALAISVIGLFVL